MKYLSILALSLACMTTIEAKEQQPKILKKLSKEMSTEKLHKLAEDISNSEDLTDAQKACLIEVIDAVQE